MLNPPFSQSPINRVRGEQRAQPGVISAKWFECDSYVSNYVFVYCRDIVDLMRRGLWEG